MLNYEPLMGDYYCPKEHDFNNLESTPFDDCCIVFSQTVALLFLRGRWGFFCYYIFLLNFEPFLGPQYFSGITVLMIKNLHYLRMIL